MRCVAIASIHAAKVTLSPCAWARMRHDLDRVRACLLVAHLQVDGLQELRQRERGGWLCQLTACMHAWPCGGVVQVVTLRCVHVQ